MKNKTRLRSLQKRKKGQIAPEFIIITAIILGVMLFVFIIAVEKNEESLMTRHYLSAKSVADEFSLTVNQIHFAGPEAKRSAWVPEKLPGNTIEFTLYVVPVARISRIVWNTTKGEQFYDSSLLTSYINASALNKTGEFYHVPAGEIKLYNHGGQIYVESV